LKINGVYRQQRGSPSYEDDDFRGLSLFNGSAPPKVLWLVVGNTSTQTISRIL